jgi:Transglutaminase-like superfamily
VARVTRALKLLWVGLIAMLAGAPALAEPGDPPEASVWYTIVADDGAALGHASDAFVQRGDGRDFIQTQEITVSERGGAPTHIVGRTVFSEDAAGRTVSISAASQSGRSWSRTNARIEAGRISIVRETPSERTTKEAALPPAVRFDDGEGLLRGWDAAAAPRLEFYNFNVDAMDVERVVVEAGPRDAQGRITALRRRYEGEALVSVARLTLDGDGRILEIAQPMFGATIRIQTTDRETALRPYRAYHVVPNAMTRSPFRISQSARQGHIRYRLAFRDGIEFALPQTGEQSARAAPGAVIVDICADCGPGMPADAAALADALRATDWMQSDDPRLHAIADPVARLDVPDARKMELLAARARATLERVDFSGHYSALDTLARRAGDCTEAAVLLAALGRAAGIPTRVVSGLVYTRESYHGVSNAFLPHSWVLAWADGKWRSFDAAMGPFDSTHIALTIGDGDARSIVAAGQLASLLRFDSLAEVRLSDGG